MRGDDPGNTHWYYTGTLSETILEYYCPRAKGIYKYYNIIIPLTLCEGSAGEGSLLSFFDIEVQGLRIEEVSQIASPPPLLLELASRLLACIPFVLLNTTLPSPFNNIYVINHISVPRSYNIIEP